MDRSGRDRSAGPRARSLPIVFGCSAACRRRGLPGIYGAADLLVHPSDARGLAERAARKHGLRHAGSGHEFRQRRRDRRRAGGRPHCGGGDADRTGRRYRRAARGAARGARQPDAMPRISTGKSRPLGKSSCFAISAIAGETASPASGAALRTGEPRPELIPSRCGS